MNIAISNSVFGRNRASGYATSGGGICLQGRGVRCSLTESVSFTMNSARLNGGAMHISDQASTTIHNATFVGNEAMNGGGAALFVLVSLCSEIRHRRRPVGGIAVLRAQQGFDLERHCDRYEVPLQPSPVQQSRRRMRRRRRLWIERHREPLQLQGK